MPATSITTFLFLSLFAAFTCATKIKANPKKPSSKVVSNISKITGIMHRSEEGIEFDIKSLTIREPEYRENPDHKAYRFYIQGALHGDEILTTVFANWIAKRIEQGQSRLNSLPAGTTIDILPVANPDRHGAHRYNANHVNLNRNFSVLWGLSSEPAGSKQFSEAETKAIKALFQQRKYLAAIDLHGYLNWVVAPSAPTAMRNEILTSNSKIFTIYPLWLSSLSQAKKQFLGDYITKTAAELGDGGAFEDWAYWEQGVMSACLELSHRTRFVYDSKTNKIIDSFQNYEAFIAHLFQSAIEINKKTTDLLFAESESSIHLIDRKTYTTFYKEMSGW